MKHGQRLVMVALVAVGLAVALILLAVGDQGAQAQGTIIYVDADAIKGADDGTSWSDAFLELQSALDVAMAGDQIWVSEGTYRPTVEHGGEEHGISDDRLRSFQLKHGVAIYGGFEPRLLDDTWEERDWVNHVTILSGDLDGNDGPDFANNDENSFHVFYHADGSALDSSAILDGFTISGGNADFEEIEEHYRGGGMTNDDGASPTLSNLTFADNWAGSSGGGIFNGSASAPTLTNCTFADNSASWGGGMANSVSSPTLMYCTFVGNSAGNMGGGMVNEEGSSPTLTDTTFSGNLAGNMGGGMYNHEASPILSWCTFAGNSAGSGGGGMLNSESSPTLTNVTFTGNSCGENGGGMYNVASQAELSGCRFMSNSAGSGGGMYNSGSWPTLTGCTFLSNSADSGGGMFNYNFSAPTLTGCTFAGNWADTGGGMTNNEGSVPSLINCTFWGNSAVSTGGGINNEFSSPPLTNCILWGNSPDQIYDDEYSSPAVTYSDVQGGYPGTGNIDVDPVFLDASNWDFHVGTGSPCIDAGNNAAPDLPPRDFDGDPRILDGDGDGIAIVDMGVDEAWGPPSAVIYVDQDAAGTNSGTSWADAFTDLQDALNWAVAGVEIWVAEGTYKPSGGGEAIVDRVKSFQMVNGVGIYGGFDPSVGDDTWEDRDWVHNPTILSCDLNGDDGPDFANNDENCYHVFYHRWGLTIDSSAILDGFTITGGNANEGILNGGGMLNDGTSPSLANCSFVGNSASGMGGGMFTNSASPVLTNVTFSNNSAGPGSGGGMANWNASPTVTGCSFSGNSAGSHGGGMYNTSPSRPTLTDCSFDGNSAGVSGGGVYNGSGSLPTLTGSTFADNWAGTGGGMYSCNASPVLTNCTFSGNSAAVSGGGMSDEVSSPMLTNCILWGNSPDQISDDASSSPAVTYSDVQGGYPGTGNIDADPLFVNAPIGDFHLGPGSPCIDVGDNTAAGLPLRDFEGDPRIMDGDGDGTAVVDMGVDELWVPPPPVIYVDQDATGIKSGLSWADAFTDLQLALDWAVAGGEIWVAEGIYKPTVEHGGSGDRFRSFQMVNGVAIYGGFDPSTGDDAWDERDWTNNVTILSGDLNGDDGPDFANNDENSYHVLFHPWELALDSSASLDGFTITGGNANLAPDDGLHNRGGGMGNFGASPTVANCIFEGNSASYRGGGMFNNTASPVVTNCTFSANHAEMEGGGMSNWVSSPAVTGCTFEGNWTDGWGGGMRNAEGSAPVLIDCIFLDNEAGGWGGGMVNLDGSAPVLINCTFAGNRAVRQGGGGMYNRDASPVLTNCTFWGNVATSGGGIFNDATSAPTVTNCILWGDSAGEIAGGSPAVTYSDVEGGYPGTGNLDADPLFLDPASGDFHLAPGSPCIDAGDNAAPSLPTYDFEGDDRIMDGDGNVLAIVDMGVDEVAITWPYFRSYLPLVLGNR